MATTICQKYIFYRHKNLKFMKFPINTVLVSFVLACAVSPSAHAIDGASLEFATGNKTQFVRAGTQWNWRNQWFKSDNRHIGTYWDATLAYWQGNDYRRSGAKQTLFVIGIMPVFRFQANDKKGYYAEGGIGMHYLSDIYSNNGRSFSTNFQFGDHLGAGYVTEGGLDIALKLQHYSNGAIKRPNPGANFVVLKLAYPL
jgi:lipid A 3-O-deacylase